MSHQAWLDADHEVHRITKVGPLVQGWYDVGFGECMGIGIEARYGVEPRVGDEFAMWGGFGFPARGMALNGRVLFYRTPDEEREHQARENDKRQAERIAEYEGKRADYDRRVAALPAPLRERIEGFRAFKGETWRWEFEPYEMASCEEAARIAERFNTADAVRRFAKLPYEKQRAAHPTMDSGHSGNTWGHALRLAVLLCERPDLVPNEHAAICPIVGCKDAGCWSARPSGPSRGGGDT